MNYKPSSGTGTPRSRPVTLSHASGTKMSRSFSRQNIGEFFSKERSNADPLDYLFDESFSSGGQEKSIDSSLLKTLANQLFRSLSKADAFSNIPEKSNSKTLQNIRTQLQQLKGNEKKIYMTDKLYKEIIGSSKAKNYFESACILNELFGLYQLSRMANSLQDHKNLSGKQIKVGTQIMLGERKINLYTREAVQLKEYLQSQKR
jgi:hypothetical protein